MGWDLSDSRFRQPIRLIDPYDLDQPVTMGYFRDNLTQLGLTDILREPARVHAEYAKYQRDFTSRQNWGFFLNQQQTAHFRERYSDDPEMTQQREAQRALGWKGRPEAFLGALEDGKFNDVSFDAKPVAQSETAEESNEVREDTSNGDTEMHDASPQTSRTSCLPSSIFAVDLISAALTKQIFIKSISPNILRSQLEKVSSFLGICQL